MLSGEAPAGRILVVDDEKSIRVSLGTFLRDAGYEVDVAEDVRAAETLLAACVYDVVVSDVVLPGMSGVDLLQRIRKAAPDVQAIMMTGEPTVETATKAVRLGACDYLAKPVAKNAILRSVANGVKLKRLDDERKRLSEENLVYQRNLERLVQERTRELQNTLHDWKNAAEGTILAMATAVEARDPYTAGHQQRVARLARATAAKMGLSSEATDAVYYAGLVHDLGKISVPSEILSNPGKLCAEAMSLVRKHSESGSRILEKVKFPWEISRIVLEHHERMDGSGYPRGLVGDAISIEARIVAVADVVEAMASHRPYRPALGLDAALGEIRKGRGTLYDGKAVDACLAVFLDEGFTLDGLDTVSAA